ncbi:MAG: chloride channel protein [Deltaproteobacteria bacterium]|nr:chloride channel protein [Deltaproteobacteria bacterium]
MSPPDQQRPGWRNFRFPTLGQAPLDLRIVGRTLLHAVIVGAAAGTLGVLFFHGLEVAQYWALERATGFVPLRARGEPEVASAGPVPFRPWLLWLVPALGALLGGWISARFAPETQGGGGDAMIDAFHTKGGVIRRRVVVVKGLASIFTLGSGGSGGREGPTMQIGAAIGSIVARYLRVDTRERRILLVAGCAAGMAAVFRTPLGAALLAVEILYRDDFESDALIPALLASVVSYSVFVSVYGESKLFAHAPSYPFVPAHLPLYGLMALVVAVAAVLFLTVLRAVQGWTKRLRLRPWVKPAIGGLVVGAIAAAVITVLGPRLGQPGQGFGILGGGYGLAQLSIVGGGFLPEGWRAVQLLVLLLLVKIVVTSFTVGTGGSAGDFGPSLVMGGLVGGAFGRAAQLVFHDPRIDPGAFALVGMGTFYGGIAHVPVSSLVMTCELAGSYDLLVPLMLAEGVAFVALRRRSLYHAQVATKRDSPAHAHELIADVLETRKVSEVLVRDRAFVRLSPAMPLHDVLERIAENDWQDAFPVIDAKGDMIGLVDTATLRGIGADHEVERVVLAADVMRAPVTVKLEDDLHDAVQAMLQSGFRELPVVDEAGKIVGFLDEADVARVYVEITEAVPPPSSTRGR